MRVFQKIKEKNKLIIKLFNLSLFKQTYDGSTLKKYQSFLGGVVTALRYRNPYTCIFKKIYKIFGITIFKKESQEGDLRWYLFNIPVMKVSFLKRFKRCFFKYFDMRHDDIYILNANSGETCILLAYVINALIKKNKSKNPLLMATKRYHVDMINMICPNIPYVYTGDFSLMLSKDTFKIDSFRFFYLFSMSYFYQVESDIKQKDIGKSHYFDHMLDKLNISENDLSMNRICVNPIKEEECLNKLRDIGLDLNNFVFIAPEAKSSDLYDNEFWHELIFKMKEKGIDVFVNIVNNSMNLPSDIAYKSTDLTFSEAFIVVKHARKIISLRSGLTEFLLQANRPIDVLYTSFKDRYIINEIDSTHVLSGFSLKRLPFVDVDKIREFDTSILSKEECLELIFKD